MIADFGYRKLSKNKNDPKKGGTRKKIRKIDQKDRENTTTNKTETNKIKQIRQKQIRQKQIRRKQIR